MEKVNIRKGQMVISKKFVDDMLAKNKKLTEEFNFRKILSGFAINEMIEKRDTEIKKLKDTIKHIKMEIEEYPLYSSVLADNIKTIIRHSEED